MIPREVHDPAVLRAIAKEAQWTGKHYACAYRGFIVDAKATE